MADSVSVEVAAESLQFSNEVEGTGVDRGTLLYLGGRQCNSASGEEGNGSRVEPHIDCMEVGDLRCL